MADSTEATFAPLIGYENLVTINDPAPSPGGPVTKPSILNGAGDYILLNDKGDGNGADSFPVRGGTGRPGSLKTVLQFLMEENLQSDTYEFFVLIGIPPGIRGLVFPGFSVAQLNTTNAPLYDPTKMTPLVYAQPSGSFLTTTGIVGPGNFQAISESEFPSGTVFQAYVQEYLPPQAYPLAPILAAPENFPYGMVEIRFIINYAIDGISAGEVTQLTVDFSHTITN